MNLHRLLVLPSISVLAACGGTETAVNEVSYACIGDQRISVRYFLGQTRADLSYEGKTFSLNQLPSGSGIRYSDGNLTLLGKGDEAFVEQAGARLFDGCKVIE